MDSYKSRPKINPKIIFNYLLPDTKKALIIGNNNSDIIEILKQKRITFSENRNIKEKQFIEYLETLQNKEFSIIILNLELCNYNRINTILKFFVSKFTFFSLRIFFHFFTLYTIFSSSENERLFSFSFFPLIEIIFTTLNTDDLLIVLPLLFTFALYIYLKLSLMSSSFSLCELCFTELSLLAMILDSLKIEVNILVVFPVEREVLLFFLDKVNIERVD